MDRRYLAFVTAHPDFYDEAWTEQGPGDLAMGTALPWGWSRVETGPWMAFHNGTPLPTSGWKVHVGSRPEHAAAVVEATLAVCFDSGVAVKCLRSTRLVRLTQAKYVSPETSGKVLTAYPANDTQLTQVVQSLRARLAGLPSARVMGDIPVPGSPVSLRFGSFLQEWMVDEHGTPRPGLRTGDGLVPDRRGAPTQAHGTPPPQLVQQLQAEQETEDAGRLLPLSGVRLLHRSNAGGIYAGTWESGRAVVIKEARHHTGFDEGGADAATRLAHEHAVLSRLQGSGVVPEVLDLVTVGSSDFLVMEFVNGETLAQTLSTKHPCVLPGGGDVEDFQALTDTILRRARAAVDVLHRHGVVHRDLHPGNLVADADRVVLIDLESSALDGVAPARGVANAAFYTTSQGGPTDDLESLDRMAEVMVSPLAVLPHRRAGLAEDIRRVGLADLAAGGTPGREQPHATTDADRLIRGIEVAATPHREDWLFPGDIAALAGPGAGAGLLHGATGVLLALNAVHARIDPVWRTWLRDRATSASPRVRGLADGLDGLALGLALLGDLEAATDLVIGAPAATSPAPWWYSGRAGLALASAEIAHLTDDARLWNHAEEHVAQTVTALDAGNEVAGLRPGLFRGWSGVALALLRIAELAEDGALADTCLQAAARALRRERDHLVPAGTGLFGRDGGRLMPFLGVGSAAFGYAAAAQTVRPSGDSWVDEVAQVASTMRVPVVLGSGITQGRAGNLLVLSAIAPGDPAVEAHRRRLAWHTLPGSATTTMTDHADADFALGEQNLRCSLDLATGSAGVLLATSPTGSPLTQTLRFPQVAPGPAVRA